MKNRPWFCETPTATTNTLAGNGDTLDRRAKSVALARRSDVSKLGDASATRVGPDCHCLESAAIPRQPPFFIGKTLTLATNIGVV